MYAKKIQLINYGPIEKIDIALPFDEERPKPFVLVGENGSGKSICLSHIVNGLITAQSTGFPQTPEVQTGRVYKFRSPYYIRTGTECYFARVDFSRGLHIVELNSIKPKNKYSEMPIPSGMLNSHVQQAWNAMPSQSNDYYASNIKTQDQAQEIFSKNCVLYFPSNRFEEPAWLNEENLNSRARYMDLTDIAGRTDRKVINHSPLQDVQNWLFDLAYDRAAFEIQTQQTQGLATLSADKTYVPLPNFPLFVGYQGSATYTYELTLKIVRSALRLGGNGRLGIGRRANRVISIMEGNQTLVPNIFQLSSGEVSLLNLFLSILRDFDLCGAPFSKAEDVRGIVIVDEIDLHLHALHQYEILPKLMHMFPHVQFIVTSHSPLFILGLRNAYGEEGFDLYRLPHGRKIDPEEFEEFSEVYCAFKETDTHWVEIRTAIENAQKPILFVDGETDVKYLQRASELLGYNHILEAIEVRGAGGDSNLKKAWTAIAASSTFGIIRQKIVILHDCDSKIHDEDAEHVHKRKIPPVDIHPIVKGIENLFSKKTIEKAREHKLAFIDIVPSHEKLKRGEKIVEPESWTVNEDEKTNLCNWLCENGTEKDFENFGAIFDILKDIPELLPEQEPDDSE